MTTNTPAGAKKRRIRHRRCKLCSVQGTPDAPISARGMCAPCGEARLADEIRQLREKSGPEYERWRIKNFEAAIKAMGPGVMATFGHPVAGSSSQRGIDARKIAS